MTLRTKLERHADNVLFARFEQLGVSPTDWCCKNVIIDEPEYRGRFEIRGAEYIREPLDDFANDLITDEVLVMGSQSRKTTLLMAGTTWAVKMAACTIFWVMATLALARKTSRNRLQKMLKASLPDMIPKNPEKNGFTVLEMNIGEASISLAGSNSPAGISSTPASRVILDEVEKFDTGGRGEADAVNLAEQRCKNANRPQRWKTSTPGLSSGLIWREFLKGDQRRYEVPCPHCSQFVIFAWSKQYSIFKPTGREAYVKWDAAKVNGKWNLDEVERTAHAECPHCHGKIRDGHKTLMIRGGKWVATNPNAASSFRSRHLPSMYSTAPEANFGRMAKRFLEAKQSFDTLQGFINGDLAEPYISQDTVEHRAALVTDRARVETTAEWVKLMTVDCQQKVPYFWYVCRAWNGRDSEGFDAGHSDSWDELRATQQKHKIADNHICVDSGFGAKSEAEVYANCARFSEVVERNGKPAFFVGWIPTKGMPARRRWKDSETGLILPWTVSEADPYSDTPQQGLFAVALFEYSAEFFKDILAKLRAQEKGVRWSATSAVWTDEYVRHLDAWRKEEVRIRGSTQTVNRWIARDKRWPDHLADCEVAQIALASFHGMFPID